MFRNVLCTPPALPGHKVKVIETWDKKARKSSIHIYDAPHRQCFTFRELK